jgi:hypothetical protein
MPEDFRLIAAPAAEDEKIATVRIALQALLNLQGQPLHAAPHVRVARRDPHPTALGNGDHDRNALKVAAINAEGAFTPIRTRAFFISTSIAPPSDSFAAAAGSSCEFSTTNCVKPDSLAPVRASRRHL